MPYKFVDGQLVAETDKNYLSLSSSKRELFEALMAQVERAEAAEARAARIDADNRTLINENKTLEDRLIKLQSERDDFGRKCYVLMHVYGARILEIKAENTTLRGQLEKLRTACNITRPPIEDVDRLQWLQSLITMALANIETISGGDVNAGLMCISEVQALHDGLKNIATLPTIGGSNE